MVDTTVGVIGLGIMGKPMAENLLEAGYSVTVHNRSHAPVEALTEAGASPAFSPAEVAAAADAIITVLPETADVREVVLGEEGIVEGISGGETVIDMSTISPVATVEIAERLAEADVDMLDAPISGGEEGAIAGTLSIMVGGDESAFNAQLDVFEAMGSTVTHCGPNGSGQVAKACNQIVVSTTMQGISEALVFAKKAGADLDAVVQAISGGAAGCWALDNRAPTMIRGDFSPGFFASYQYKDLRIATGAAEEYGAVMPATELAHEMYKSMEEQGFGRDDNSGILQVIEGLAGVEARVE